MHGHRLHRDRTMKLEDRGNYCRLSNLQSKESNSYYSNKWLIKLIFINNLVKMDNIFSKGKKGAVLTNRGKIIK